MLKVEKISVKIEEKLILNNLSFETKRGEVLAIVGENGAGKSTLLNSIYGTQKLSQGKVFFNDYQVPDPEEELIPGVKEMGYVTQALNFDRFLKVYDNLAQELKMITHDDKHRLVMEIADTCYLTEILDKNIEKLSGGEKQRATLAKALIKGCEFYLFDEPYSHLDIINQQIMKSIINRLKSEGKTILIVTHDSKEALKVADKILVLRNGRIEQNDTVKEIYERPVNSYVENLFHQLVIDDLGNTFRVDSIQLLVSKEGKFRIEKVLKINETSYLNIVVYNNQRFTYRSKEKLSLDSFYAINQA